MTKTIYKVLRVLYFVLYVCVRGGSKKVAFGAPSVWVSQVAAGPKIIAVDARSARRTPSAPGKRKLRLLRRRVRTIKGVVGHAPICALERWYRKLSFDLRTPRGTCQEVKDATGTGRRTWTSFCLLDRVRSYEAGVTGAEPASPRPRRVAAVPRGTRPSFKSGRGRRGSDRGSRTRRRLRRTPGLRRDRRSGGRGARDGPAGGTDCTDCASTCCRTRRAGRGRSCSTSSIDPRPARPHSPRPGRAGPYRRSRSGAMTRRALGRGRH